MRLGKEQAVGVVEEPAAAHSMPVVDEPGAGDADQERLVEEVVEQGALIRTR
jgi:hypothetical protein